MAQSGITLGVVAVFLIASSGALSALLGGGVVVLGTGYAAYASRRQAHKRLSAQNGNRVWRSMVAIEVQKMLLIAALSVSVFVLYPQFSPIAFFAGLIGAVAAYLLAPVLLKQ